MNRKRIKRSWKAKVNRKAREVYGHRFVVCNVATRIAKDGFKGELGPIFQGTATLTYDWHNSDDLYDNCDRLADFKLPSKDWSGTLDIWVYSYETIALLAEGYDELEFNLYAKFENGVFISVTD
jgi:hypothetical protein